MKTSEIKEMLSIYTELPRTNKFKRAVDLALMQNLPIEIKVAAPFKGFRSKAKNATFKVKVKNTETNEVVYIGKCVTSDFADSKSGVTRFGIFSASSFEMINTMILERHPEANLSEVRYNHTGAHSQEVIKEPISWSKFALAISSLFKKDFAHTSPCGKCCGSGFLPHYAHIDNGVCWDCCGSGWNLHIGQDGKKAA